MKKKPVCRTGELLCYRISQRWRSSLCSACWCYVLACGTGDRMPSTICRTLCTAASWNCSWLPPICSVSI